MELHHPSTMLIAGPSQAGKSVFIKKLLHADLYRPRPKKIIYCYSVWTDMYSSMSGITFVKGLPKIEFIKDSLLILDDLMSKVDASVSDLFTKHSHHLNCSVVFVVQNLFHQKIRTISLNSHYIIVFKNPRDVSQIQYLARQISPRNTAYVTEAYKDAISKPYGYLLIDLRPNTDEERRLNTNILPEERPQIVYVPDG